MKENFELVFFATLIILAVSVFTEGQELLSLLAFLFAFIIKIGYEKIFLKVYDGEKPKLSEMFQHYTLFWKYLGVVILNCLVVVGGIILLVIPGIYWAVRFSFAALIVVDTKSGPMAAMKESWAITKGNFWKLLLLWLAIVVINLAGIIALYVGLLITVPVTTFAAVFVYRELTKKRASLSTETISTPSTS